MPVVPVRDRKRWNERLLRPQGCSPELCLVSGSFLPSGAIGIQSGANNPRFVQTMIKHNEASIKTDMTIRQFQIVQRPARKPRFDEILQIITPIAEASSKRKGKV